MMGLKDVVQIVTNPMGEISVRIYGTAYRIDPMERHTNVQFEAGRIAAAHMRRYRACPFKEPAWRPRQ